MPAETEAIAALDLIVEDALKRGPNWETVHDIVQRHEGEPLFDAIHAMLHRIEGDDGNAAYWYRRAGRESLQGTVEDEWNAMRTEADKL